MTSQFSHERTNSLALHLGGGLTLAPAFFAPRPLKLNDQQSAHQDPECLWSFIPMRAHHLFHEDASA